MKKNKSENIILSADEAEFIADLITRNATVIRSVIRTVLQDKYEQVGEDCVSEIYLLSCKKIDVLKQHENPDGWIIVASKKTALNMGRKESKRLINSINTEFIDIPVEDNIFEDALYNIWMEKGVIDDLLGLLTAREKEIYDLLYIKRLTSKAASTILQISDSTVRNTNRVIRQKIMDAIKSNKFL